jgi:PAS domain S-box-containing protein
VTEYFIICRYPRYDYLPLLQVMYLLSQAVGARLMPQNHEEILLYGEYLRKIVETISEGYMSINKKGVITYLNRAGAEILGLKIDEVIGRHMCDVVDFQPQVLSVLDTGKGWANREFFVNMPRGQVHLIKSAIPIFSETGETVGVVDTFREMKSVRRMVADMVGAKAVFHFDDIVFASRVMGEVLKLAKAAAKNEANILIEGESGTGKELITSGAQLQQPGFRAVRRHRLFRSPARTGGKRIVWLRGRGVYRRAQRRTSGEV